MTKLRVHGRVQSLTAGILGCKTTLSLCSASQRRVVGSSWHSEGSRCKRERRRQNLHADHAGGLERCKRKRGKVAEGSDLVCIPRPKGFVGETQVRHSSCNRTFLSGTEGRPVGTSPFVPSTSSRSNFAQSRCRLASCLRGSPPVYTTATALRLFGALSRAICVRLPCVSD